jgi:hypothetical protein
MDITTNQTATKQVKKKNRQKIINNIYLNCLAM